MLGLGLAWTHFQDKKLYIYTSLKDCSLHDYEQTYVLNLVSDSQRLSFSQEWTPTLILGLSLGLGLGFALGHFQNKYFLSTQVFNIFP